MKEIKLSQEALETLEKLVEFYKVEGIEELIILLLSG